MDDRAGAGGVGMVEGPDLDKAVVVRCLGRQRAGAYTDSRGAFDEDEDETVESFAPVEMINGYAELQAANTAGEDSSSREISRGQPEERTIRMQRGEIWLVRWSSVREAVASGECELL